LNAAPPRLVLFSGPPGMGKSALSYRLSRETGWAVLSKDGVDQGLKVCPACPPVAGYDVMFSLAALNLGNGASVILDAVFGLPDFRRRAIDLAARYGARFHAIACFCSDHELWRRRVESRPEAVRGWTPADWAEAERVAGYYQPWTSPHLTLDAAWPFEHNVALLLAAIRGE